MAQVSTAAQLLKNEPLTRYTSWRVGGPAEQLYIADSLPSLQAFLKGLPVGEPVTFIGLGSNLLVRDGGVKGTVIVMHQALKDLVMDGDLIYADAGVTCAKFARFSANNSKSGGEFMAGIPGTVGGALAMNARCVMPMSTSRVIAMCKNQMMRSGSWALGLHCLLLEIQKAIMLQG